MNEQENRIRLFKNKVESFLEDNSMLALDLFYVHNFMKFSSKSFTLSTLGYVKNILLPFIDKYGSMGNTSEFEQEVINYNTITHTTQKTEIVFREIDNIVPNSKESNFHDMVKHLKENKFGSFAYWHNSRVSFQNKSINISIFFILETPIELGHNIDKINSLILEYITPEINRLLLEESVMLNKKLISERELERIRANAFEEINDELRSHTHTFKMFDACVDLENALERVQEIGDEDLIGYFSNAYKSVFFRNLFNGIMRKKGDYYNKVNELTSINRIFNLIFGNDTVFFPFKKDVIDDIVFENNNDYFIDKENVIDYLTIFLNLWSNAIKHSPDNKLSVRIKNDSDSNYIIYFENKGYIEQDKLDYALGKGSKPKNTGYGLSQIRTKIPNYPITLEGINKNKKVIFKLSLLK